MPPLRLTRRADGAAGHDGEQGAGVRPAAAGVAGGLDPPDHFSRHLESALDLAFVRDLVKDADAERGRPSIDPVIFCKLQHILCFVGLRSERQLMRTVADRLSLRWDVGYDLAEPLPDIPASPGSGSATAWRSSVASSR